METNQIERCCGLMCTMRHRRAYRCCGRRQGRKVQKLMRTFGTFLTCELRELCAWPSSTVSRTWRWRALAVTDSGLCGTGERAVPDAAIVGNAHHIKNVPGRKTDCNDAQWLATLVRLGNDSPKLRAAAGFGVSCATCCDPAKADPGRCRRAQPHPEPAGALQPQAWRRFGCLCPGLAMLVRWPQVRPGPHASSGTRARHDVEPGRAAPSRSMDASRSTTASCCASVGARSLMPRSKRDCDAHRPAFGLHREPMQRRMEIPGRPAHRAYTLIAEIGTDMSVFKAPTI